MGKEEEVRSAVEEEEEGKQAEEALTCRLLVSSTRVLSHFLLLPSSCPSYAVGTAPALSAVRREGGQTRA